MTLYCSSDASSLAVVQQVLGEAANGVEIVAIEDNGVTIGIDGVLVVLTLLIGSAESGIEFGGTRGIRDGTENFAARAQCRLRRCRAWPTW